MTTQQKLPARVALPSGDVFVAALFRIESRDEQGARRK